MFTGYPLAQWQTLVGVSSGLLIDKEITELLKLLMVSEFLPVSKGLNSALRIISLRFMAKVLVFSMGIEG